MINSDPNAIKMETNEQYSVAAAAANLLNHFDAKTHTHPIVSVSPPTMVGLGGHTHPLTGTNGAAGAGGLTSPSSYRSTSSTSKQRWNESPEARARRLARNAERMRERRARESEDEYRKRLARNAEANRIRRQNENEVERAMRLVRNAARQRLRRAMETPEQRAKRLAKLAERMRIYRAIETPEQRKERLAAMAARARDRIARETSEERKDRLRKLSEYAKRVRANKGKGGLNSHNQNEMSSPRGSNQTQQHSGGQMSSQQQQQNHISNQQQPYAHQTLANSIEYYQNMFINSALRPNIKESQSQIQNAPNASILQGALQNSRFSQQPNTQNLVAMESNSQAGHLFQNSLYDNNKVAIQKFQQSQYQTLTSSIEFYQNKFIKAKQEPSLDDIKNSSPSSDESTLEKAKKNLLLDPHQHIQNPPAALYNQFPYLNSFPAAAAAAASSNAANQQNYYPMYHNGFQLSIAPNSVPPPFTPVHFQNATGVQPQSPSYTTLLNSTTQSHQVSAQDFPKPVRGRPRKIFPDNNEIPSRVPVDVQEEAIRQQKVNALLENEINQMLAGPRRYRARPGRSQENDEERKIRLQKIAAHQRQVRANETPEERAKRLQKLSERARQKRQEIRETETPDQRKDRLAKQAEYARQRRMKSQTPEHKKKVEDKAKELYAQLHTSPPPPPIPSTVQQTSNNPHNVAQHHHHHQHHHQQSQQIGGSGGMVSSDDFVKNPGKDFGQSENNDVLKILEPIIIMKIKTLHSIDTEYSADSIEWCPHPEYQSYFVCGTYQLEGDNSESTSPPCRRKGRIYLFRYDLEDNILQEMCRIETAAILDMKWQNNLSGDGIPILATANALGQVEIFSLNNEKLKLLCTVDLNENFHNLLTLSLDWSWKSSPLLSSSSSSSSSSLSSSLLNQCIVASDSKGDISLLSYVDGGVLRKVTTWSAHSFEAWICAFDKWDINRIYTGGDDTFMHVFDVRESNQVLKIGTNKSHLAGVTCLLSHPKKENILLTGSYDEKLRIFDTRNYNVPLCDINLNGGIWRLKPDPLNRNLVLCACMYHNFSIVQLCDQLDQIEIVGEYNEHTSICYGADWCQKFNNNNSKNLYHNDDKDDNYGDDDNNKSDKNYHIEKNDNRIEMIMATCSFYDHKLCISSITMN